MDKRKKTNYVSVMTLMIFFAIITTFPYYWTLKTSLEVSSNVYKFPPDIIPNPATFKNYTVVWNQLGLVRYYLNSILLTSVGVVVNVFLAAMAAYPLARFNFYGKKIVFFLILLPLMLPFQGGLIVNYLTLRNMHLLNTYTGVILPLAVSAFGIFLFRQAYLGIPKDFEDAARIDGAGEFYIWLRIMTPLISPTISAFAILQAITWWDIFLWPLIVLSDSQKYPLAVALMYLNSTFQTNFKYTAAGMILATLPLIIAFLFMQRFFIKGLTAGGVKY
ncbi:MAG: carbohydrate ABC transporter permease [Thermotoga sp.]|nr:carbohydrate ABC transporter permease [Thermotogota bacterium]RKX54959.1 MAG: carbohydrate ABC transporter permease [Thermotoga sp.]